jgi:hypothetical protein
MPGAKKICFDRVLPQELRRPMRTMSRPGGRTRAIAPKHTRWVNGSTIRIRFLEGDQDRILMVKRIAPTWTEFANLKFEFTEDPRAEIRVSFDPQDGAWSYIGTDNLGIPRHAATLNLGWVDQAVILHEFGHMVGLAHEHQNPEGGIDWNEDAVIRDLSGPPNYWDEDTIRHNVLEKYSVDQINGTEFDPDSIMLYAFPDEWTANTPATHENEDLSQLDKQFIQSEVMYPRTGAPADTAVVLKMGDFTGGKIATGGEEDLYRFTVKDAGVYTVETSGATDVVLSVFGPDSPTKLVGTDDDSGVGLNARLRRSLSKGEYLVKVTHYDPSGKGNYKVRVRAH